ncbi:MAG TPA: hypothetical protein VE961_07035 [Pyrinomonadaceae bacterium]|nr:hypothetical protein [Pyrinomonadaceae bacterium]
MNYKTSLRFVTLIIVLATTPVANATLLPNPNGKTVYDTLLGVNWAANANLPGTVNNNFDGRLGFPQCDGVITVPCVDQNGAMSYETALLWLSALNGLHGGNGYLDHTDWTLPTTAQTDPTCSAIGPNNNSFGFGCRNSALGSLYYTSLGFAFPDTAIPIPANTNTPFNNIQPYLYWSATGTSNNGFQTFSLNTGWEGSNVNAHYMYVLPMIPRKVERPGITYISAGLNHLKVSSDGQMVYDPDAVDPGTGHHGVTWLADANLAATHKFGIHCLHPDGTRCINPDGSMRHETAVHWINRMNKYHGGDGWLGQTDWDLPATDLNDLCGQSPPAPPGTNNIPSFNCQGSPLGELFYNELSLTQGMTAAVAPDLNLTGMQNLQPYLYWSCNAPDTQLTCDGTLPAAGFGWSFSFGNGFQGTDVKKNNLYVMVYYPDFPINVLIDGIDEELRDYPNLRATLVSDADGILFATTKPLAIDAFNAFAAKVKAHRGNQLTAAEVNYLIALAQTILEARQFKTPPPPPCKPRCV